MKKTVYDETCQKMVVELMNLNRKHLNCNTSEKYALLERYNELRQEFSDFVTWFHSQKECGTFSSAPIGSKL